MFVCFFLTAVFKIHHTADLIVKKGQSNSAVLFVYLNPWLLCAWWSVCGSCVAVWIWINGSFFSTDISPATAFHASGIQLEREDSIYSFLTSRTLSFLSYPVVLCFCPGNDFCSKASIAILDQISSSSIYCCIHTNDFYKKKPNTVQKKLIKNDAVVW